jgi:acetoacetyl-CoA synthetase
MGTSEIYRAVLSIDAITDALVVDVDGWMPLFVVLRDGVQFDEDLEARIRNRIREHASPRHVPDEVVKRGAVDVPELLEIYAEHARSRSRRDGG